MKKILVLLLALVMLAMGAFLIACDEETDDDNDGDNTEQGGETNNGGGNGGGGTDTTDEQITLYGSELGENVPYKLEFTSNGNETCSVSGITVNTAYTKDFELTIPSTSPNGDTVTAITWGDTFVVSNVPMFITVETLNNILDWFENNGYDLYSTPVIKLTAFYNLYNLKRYEGTSFKDALLEVYPILEYFDEIYVFTGEQLREFSHIKRILDIYSPSLALDEYHKIIKILSEKTNSNTELIKKCYPDAMAPNNTNQATWISNLNLPDTLITIGNNSFNTFSELTEVNLPYSLTTIGEKAFAHCALTSITISSNVTTIGKEAFSNCIPLQKINFNAINCADLSSSSNIFINSGFLIKVVFGDNVSRIPANLFNDNSIHKVIIPNSVTSIGSCAFFNCTNLQYIMFKGTQEQWDIITKGSMWDTYQANNDKLNYSLKYNYFYYEDGGLVFESNNDNQSLYVSEYNGKMSSVLIPDSFEGMPVTNIGDSAFYGCTGLTSVTIPDTVTSIDSSAFRNCYKLVEVINKSSLTITKGSSNNGYVGYYALEVHTGESKIVNKDGYLFYTYNGVNYLIGYIGTDTQLTLPNDYNGQGYEICKYAFYNNDKITSVVIPNSVTSIGDDAFENCTSLTSITIPDSVTSIGYGAFWNCTALTNIKYRGTQAQWNAISKSRDWDYGTGDYTITYNYTGE